MRSRLPSLKKLFEANAGRFALPGQRPFMSVEEFLDMLDQASLLDATFTVVDAKECFVTGMHPVVNEQQSNAHHNMYFQEFLATVRRWCCAPLDSRMQHAWGPPLQRSLGFA